MRHNTVSMRVASIASGLWVAVLVVLTTFLYIGWFPKTSGGQSLTVNDLGAWLSGAVAPLAFLWFYVSTSMQREELNLQRMELEETRKVLADQQVQLEIAAKESAEQTKIMQSREVFEEHRILLYYLAVFICDNRNLQFTDLTIKSRRPVCFYRPIPGFSLEQNDYSVDKVMARFEESLKEFEANPPGINLADHNFRGAVSRIWHQMQYLITDPRFSTNPLVRARIQGARLSLLHDRLTKAALYMGVPIYG